MVRAPPSISSVSSHIESPINIIHIKPPHRATNNVNIAFEDFKNDPAVQVEAVNETHCTMSKPLSSLTSDHHKTEPNLFIQFKIVIKGLGSKDIFMDVSPAYTVRILWGELHNRQLIPSGMSRICYNLYFDQAQRTPLRDEQTLSSLGVKPLSVLCVRLRVLGGALNPNNLSVPYSSSASWSSTPDPETWEAGKGLSEDKWLCCICNDRIPRIRRQLKEHETSATHIRKMEKMRRSSSQSSNSQIQDGSSSAPDHTAPPQLSIAEQLQHRDMLDGILESLQNGQSVPPSFPTFHLGSNDGSFQNDEYFSDLMAGELDGQIFPSNRQRAREELDQQIDELITQGANDPWTSEDEEIERSNASSSSSSEEDGEFIRGTLNQRGKRSQSIGDDPNWFPWPDEE
ncbi:hypothetical protein M422DRAFT_247655, partial [Sphaerobolus stellatus SS14]